MAVHPSAIIEKGARIHRDAEIGPFCYIGPRVKIGAGCRLIRSVIIEGKTVIGENNTFHPFCVIGGDPQDFKFRGEESETVIGDGNTFRENVTVNKGTAIAGNRTMIGDRNYIMACSHIAHDTVIEDGCVLANQVLLAGHMRVGMGAVLSGQVAVHHFVSIGRYAFVGGCSRINQDVPPYTIVQGFEEKVHGINSIGLRRRGMDPAAIKALREAYRMIWRSELPKSEALQRIEKQENLPEEVRILLDFIHASDRGRMGRALEARRPSPLVPGEKKDSKEDAAS